MSKRLIRDSRLPPVGAVIVRRYRGKVHRVAVLENGFEWNGRVFNTLATVAFEITGSIKSCRGWRFFGNALAVARGEIESAPPSPTCVHGHEYTTENTYEHRGTRYCRKCHAESARRSRRGALASDERCGRGHERTAINTWTSKDGQRQCLDCREHRRALARLMKSLKL